MIQCDQHWELLREYVERGSEPAFAKLVAQHVDIVYSAALRQVRDKHLAEEVTQIVFIVLARKAKSIRPGTILSAWLYKTARYTALNLLRTETRRRSYERKAAEMNSEFQRVDSCWSRLSPMLDEGIARLSESDRAAIILRYFQQHSMAETASTLGVSEQAAAMRIHRAIEKLRAFFRDRRVDLPAGALVGVISANSAHAAPQGLAGALTIGALAAARGGAAAGAISVADAVSRAMALAKAKAVAFVTGAIVASVLIAGIAANYAISSLAHRSTQPPVNRESTSMNDGDFQASACHNAHAC
ncbi:MAG TPA: sigma-70 family RNA polymerase sigma factor [Tepidisphaeraceae bacterium]|nr:sigma-70 family RNA polymerase sigma factor [Tepidisphaeraceae bacterium]